MPRKIDMILQDQAQNRLNRLINFSEGTLPANSSPKAAVVRRVIGGKTIEPNVQGLGQRTASYVSGKFQQVAIPTSARVITDAQMSELKPNASGFIEDAAKILNPNIDKVKLAKAADYIGTYMRWNGVLMPEYDMQEPHAIADTEVFVKQTVARKKALAARAGYEIMSDRQDDADYIQSRIDAMEYVTDRTFESLLQDILQNLFLASNCFLMKIRKSEACLVEKGVNGRKPVAAYVIVPAHTIRPYLKDGQIIKWRRFFDHGVPFIDYDLDDVIHLKWDVKPGHIFGTPRTIAVRDDIFALRRLEENIELLFINHLFPLFHVKVGTEKAPCTYGPNGESEIDMVRYMIETMPKEGVFVTDERVEVSAVGAEGKSLDFSKLVEHFKARVYIGLGMSAIDMGEGADATRATADNISQNLKDAIKADLDTLAGQIRMFMFKEWFREAKESNYYSTSVQKGTARTTLIFHELDLDNRIKEETHVMALFNSHLLTEQEARKRLRYKPVADEERKNTHFWLHVVELEKQISKLQTNSQMKVAEADVSNQKAVAATQMKLLAAQTEHSQATTEHHNAKLEAQAKHMPAIAKAKVSIANASAHRAAGKPRSGTAKKTTQTAKQTSNVIRPTNQHGTKLSPKRTSDSMEKLYDELIAERDGILSSGESIDKRWRQASAKVFDRVMQSTSGEEITDSLGASYTRQERATELGNLRAVIQETSDPELLSVLIRAEIEDEVDPSELQFALADHAA